MSWGADETQDVSATPAKVTATLELMQA